MKTLTAYRIGVWATLIILLISTSLGINYGFSHWMSIGLAAVCFIAAEVIFRRVSSRLEEASSAP